ncbi:MAG: YicC/YloC family endoribonuclease, partial [Planctomycetota bacterium]
MSQLASMTGFGKASGSGSRGEEVVVEVRSFNSKSFKLSVRLPGIFAPHEEAVRALVRKHVRRGSVALTVRFRSPADLPDVRINAQLLEKYARELKALGEGLSLDTRVDLAQLANL